MPALRLPNGSTISVATAYDAAVDITALSNAKPAVATAGDHDYVNGDLIEVVSGWSLITDRVFRVAAAAAEAFSLERSDTTNIDRFPAGSGVGSARKVSTWQQLVGVMEPSITGGEQQNYQYGFLEDIGDDRQLPTTRSPMSLAVPMADNPDAPHHEVLLGIDEDRVPRAVKVVLPGGDLLVVSAIVTYNPVPTLQRNVGMVVTATLAFQGRPLRYNKLA